MGDSAVQIAIFGAGGFGRELAWLVEESSDLGGPYQLVCLVDDDKALEGTSFHETPVLSLEAAYSRFPEAKMLVGVGKADVREMLAKRAESIGFSFATLFHKSVLRSRFVKVGKGTVVCAGSALTTEIAIGEHVHVNLGCTIGHDVHIGDFSTLGPGVHIAGHVRIGRSVYIGAGTVIINGKLGDPLMIGEGSTIGAGSCVLRSIPEGSSVFGVPARPIPRATESPTPASGAGSGSTVSVSVGLMNRQSEKPIPEKTASTIRIVILGAGGHARVIADAIFKRALKRGDIEMVGFLDDNPKLLNKQILGRPVLGSFADLGNVPHDAVVIGIGDNETRCRLFQELSSRGEELATIIHPQATIAHDVKMGRGSVAFAGVVVNSGSIIGNNVILNTGCTVGHDCRVASHSHICPGAHLAGTVGVGEGAFVGIGVAIANNRNVGEWSTLGAGAAVIRDVGPFGTFVGVPTRELPPRPIKHRPDTRDTDSVTID